MKSTLCLLFSQVFAILVFTGCMTAKEHSSPVELRPAANSSTNDWQRMDFHVGGLDTWVAPDAVVTRDDILFATEEKNAYGEHTVTLEFTSHGAASMHTLSDQRMSRPVAVLLDGKIIAAPVLMMPVENRLTINFGSSKKGAKKAKALEDAVNEAHDSNSTKTSTN